MTVLVEGDDNNDDKKYIDGERGRCRELCCVLIGQVLFLDQDH